MIYSVGYEGRSLEDLVRTLELAGVELLVDVRLNPISRKPGFSKTGLARALEEVGVQYRHDRRLGNPPENRAGFHSGDSGAARSLFRARLSNGAREALHELAELAAGARVAVLCVEREERHCHRQVIVEELQEIHPALVSVPLA